MIRPESMENGQGEACRQTLDRIRCRYFLWQCRFQ